jgi:hypothetical protein
VRVTTLRPGYFYVSSFWEAGFDNLKFESVGSRCAVDFSGDGSVNVQDFLAFLQAFSAGEARADFDASGSVNVQDFLAFLSAYAAGC